MNLKCQKTFISNIYNESHQIIKLTFPILIASISQIGMGFIDTIMAGGVSATDMAAVAIASGIWLPFILFGIGILLVMVPIVSHLHGSNNQVKIAFEVQQSMILAILISIPIIILILPSQYILTAMKIEKSMHDKTIRYLYAISFSAPAFLLFQALRSFTDGMSITKPAMFISIIGLIINIPLNWIFVYGKFGIPRLEAVGCGVATAIVYWLMFIGLLIYINFSKKLKHINTFSTFYRPHIKTLLRILKLGLPIAGAIFFEVILFTIASLLLAPLGANVVASQQVGFNFSSLIFMLPSSIAGAVTIRVGYQLGKKNINMTKISCLSGLSIGVICALFSGVFTYIMRDFIVTLYTQDNQVRVLASQLLMFSAIYQLTDSIQIIAAGALRGYKDTSSIMKFTFISYWLLGLPVGYTLALTDWIIEPLGAKGFWIGFIVGLTSSSILLMKRLLWMHRQDRYTQLSFAQR